ncbi:hypothetical protein GGR56DRAFT_416099 [Xylariaceae sp. FL0804]|nr:hypothetical protein GGR56DRAFT_416099 [Xylariaceae sp. FL0804]
MIGSAGEGRPSKRASSSARPGLGFAVLRYWTLLCPDSPLPVLLLYCRVRLLLLLLCCCHYHISHKSPDCDVGNSPRAALASLARAKPDLAEPLTPSSLPKYGRGNSLIPSLPPPSRLCSAGYRRVQRCIYRETRPCNGSLLRDPHRGAHTSLESVAVPPGARLNRCRPPGGRKGGKLHPPALPAGSRNDAGRGDPEPRGAWLSARSCLLACLRRPPHRAPALPCFPSTVLSGSR